MHRLLRNPAAGREPATGRSKTGRLGSVISETKTAGGMNRRPFHFNPISGTPLTFRPS